MLVRIIGRITALGNIDNYSIVCDAAIDRDCAAISAKLAPTLHAKALVHLQTVVERWMQETQT
jgi:hypothetical protein